MKKLDSYFFLTASFIIAAFSHEGLWSYLAAFIGYGIFFHALFFYEEKKKRFFIASIWFFSVQILQLSWMTSTEYMTSYFLFVYFFFALALGLEFGLLVFFLPKKKELKLVHILTTCSIWTLLEWSRLFFLSGFTWNPIGLALASNHYSLQLASIFGIYGLSFWVMGVNLLGLMAIYNKKALCFTIWIAFFLLPYFFGFAHEQIISKYFKKEKKLSVLLVQTSISPKQKEPLSENQKTFISPYAQWQRIFQFLNKADKKIDLIVFPEASLPFGAYNNIYQLEDILHIWKKVFQNTDWNFLPNLNGPLAYKIEDNFWKVSNAYISLAIANYFNAGVIIGLDDSDDDLKSYNSAFYFSPNSYDIKRYEKQILLPLVEYFPFPFFSQIASKFGINGFFTPGKEAKVFNGKVPLSISICYEETFGNIIKNARKKGAELLVNISNDGYFPTSKLPVKHFQLGKVRSVENGVPTIRCCNTGITGAVDCFGRVLKIYEEKNYEKSAGILQVDVPLTTYTTIYTTCGDSLIVCVSFLILAPAGYKKRKICAQFFKKSRTSS